MPMHCEEMGDKRAPTIVFIHGGGMSGWMWQKQWEAFGDFHLLIPDLPEHGRSAAEGRISVKDGAERIAALIRERANGGRAHVVGHSLGGMIAVQLLSAQPEAVDRAVVASALFRPQPVLGMFYSKPFIRITLRSMESERARIKQAKRMAFPNEFYIENYIRESGAYTLEFLDRVYSQLRKHTALPPGLIKAQAPVLVIAGERELGAMRRSVADIASALPNAKGCLIKGGRHTYPWEKSELFNRVVRAWLTGGEVDGPDILPVRLPSTR